MTNSQDPLIKLYTESVALPYKNGTLNPRHVRNLVAQVVRAIWRESELTSRFVNMGFKEIYNSINDATDLWRAYWETTDKHGLTVGGRKYAMVDKLLDQNIPEVSLFVGPNFYMHNHLLNHDQALEILAQDAYDPRIQIVLPPIYNDEFQYLKHAQAEIDKASHQAGINTDF